MQLACTNVGCNVTLQRKGSFCMLIHRSCFGVFHLFVGFFEGFVLGFCFGEGVEFGRLVLFGCLFGSVFLGKNIWDQKLH